MDSGLIKKKSIYAEEFYSNLDFYSVSYSLSNFGLDLEKLQHNLLFLSHSMSLLSFSSGFCHANVLL